MRVLPSSPATGQAGEDTRCASLGSRLVALGVDTVLGLGVAGASFAFAVSLMFAARPLGRQWWSGLVENTLMVVVPLGLWWAYSAFLEASPKGATIGKAVAGIRVVTMTGDRVSLPRASVRFVVKAVPWFSLLLSVFLFNSAGMPTAFYSAIWAISLLVPLDLALILGTRRMQALHDMVARTMVVPRSR